MWWKKNKWRVILPVCLLALLAFAFWFGGNAPGLRGWRVEKRVVAAATPAPAPTATPADAPQGDAAYSAAQGMELDPETGLDRFQTGAVPEGMPVPVEPEDAEISDEEHKCTISISCTTILENMDWLAPEKVELVPEDGWILKPVEVTFYKGESVFNVLLRTCKQQGIHMEYTNTPMYNSAYIEGIHNLYEFDCGERSGWMYCVNGWFPNYGSSRYALKEGDVVEWKYTCDLGFDIDGGYAVGG